VTSFVARAPAFYAAWESPLAACKPTDNVWAHIHNRSLGDQLIEHASNAEPGERRAPRAERASAASNPWE
jgi:hypothetical protein